MITIRTETRDDFDTVREITRLAFTQSEYGHNGEAELVDLLRAESANHLSLVANIAGAVVGHILFTPVVIQTPQLEIHGMGLAPMAVAPLQQRVGVGSALVTEGLRRIFADDCSFVVVLGHEQYYSRFGFQPAAELNVEHGFAGLPQDVFFIRCRAGDSLPTMSRGQAYYEPQFGTQHE